MNTEKSTLQIEVTQILTEESIDLRDNITVLNKLHKNISLAEVKNEIALECGYTS